MPTFSRRQSHRSSTPGSLSRTRRSRRRYDLEKLEDRTLLSFTPIAQPGNTLPNGNVYTAGTTNLASSIPADGTTTTSLTDNIETINFSQTMTAATVPAGGFNNWGSPPNTESNTPRVLFNATIDTLTLSLSTPAATFGVEMETDIFGTHSLTANFFDGANLVGTISRSVTTPNGALLFAASTNQAFTSVVLSTPGGSLGIGIAEVRYALPVPPLTGTAGNAITGIEGSSTGTVLLGTFVDANQGATVADYTTPPGSVVVNWGDGSAPQTLAASNLTPIGTPNGVVWTISAAHTYTEEGTYAYTVTVTDVAGASTIVAGSATIADAALTAGAATLLTPNTGVALPSSTVVATFTDANTFATTADFTTNIDWGDGAPASTGVVVATATPGVFDVEGGHSYAKSGVYKTLVSVYDDGGSKVVVTGSATVTDLAVTGSTRSFTATEGISTGLFALATFTDPNTLATVADVNATLAVGGWGDGTPGAAGVVLAVQQIGVTPLTSATDPGAPIFEVLGSHTYAEETPAGLPDTLSVIITTLGGVTTTLTSPPGGGVTVLDAPLTSSNGTSITGIEGKSTGTVLIGTFSDANQGATVADYTSGGGSTVVKWGDGTTAETLTAADLTALGSPNGVIFTIDASHTYAEEGTYAYTVTVTDDGGATTVISGSAVIADAPLSFPTQTPITTTEAALFPVPVFDPPVFSSFVSNQPVATFNDANPTAPITDFTATIDWGDGTPPTAGTIEPPLLGGTAWRVFGTHTYADSGVNSATNGGLPGIYAIQVFVQDVGGSRVTVPNQADVADIPITVTGQLNPASDSGVSNTDDVTNVTQPDFFGTSQPLSHVTLSETPIAGGLSLPIGTVQAGSDGSWNITSDIALADGSYRITATAIDQFGQTTTVAPVVITSDLVIDTTGPIITGAFFNRLNGQVDYTIQDPSPASGPPSGVWVNTLLDSSNYLLTKVHANKAFPGKWIVTNVTETPGAAPNSFDVAVVFNSGKQIQGGFYLFTIRDSSNGNSSVQDIAGNHLDGVFYGSFPSGNGINGSDFVAMLSGFHFKIFSPQTIVGTASAANGGVGGPPIGAVHSGDFVPVVPVGGSPVFSTDPPQHNGTRATVTKKAVTRSHLAKSTAIAKSHSVKTAVHDEAMKTLVDHSEPGRMHK
jgi:hypothetical protein